MFIPINPSPAQNSDDQGMAASCNAQIQMEVTELHTNVESANDNDGPYGDD